MSWLFPQRALDLLVPGLLWYFCVWMVLSFVLLGVGLWYMGLWTYQAFEWGIGWYRSR